MPILTHGPYGLGVDTWFVIDEVAVRQYPTLYHARLSEPRSAVRENFVHWSLLRDEERDQVFDLLTRVV